MAHVAIQDKEQFDILGRTEKAIKAGDTTFQVRGAIPSFLSGAKVWVDVLGTSEIRVVSSVSGRLVTVTSGFSFAHEPGVVWQRSDTVKYLHAITIDGDASFSGGIEVSGLATFVDGLTAEDAVVLTDAEMSGLLVMNELADPSAPAANKVYVYARDTGGKTELVARFPTGAIQQIAIEP